jgi:alkylhydroperoxidase family enzyme
MQFNAVPREDMSEVLQQVYDRSAEVGDTQFIQAGANAPEVMEWYFQDFYAKLFYAGRVDLSVKELVRLRLTRTHGCALCNKWDASDALEAGIPAATVDAVTGWPEPLADPAQFTAPQLAALRYADQMALQNMDGALDEELYTELRRHFDDAQLFELGVVMGVFTGMYKFVFIADLTPKMAHCPVPGSVGVQRDWVIGSAEKLTTSSDFQR